MVYEEVLTCTMKSDILLQVVCVGSLFGSLFNLTKDAKNFIKYQDNVFYWKCVIFSFFLYRSHGVAIVE